MGKKKLVEAYRRKLAAIEYPWQMDGQVLNAVFYGATPGHDERVGTILSVHHSTGIGLFGPTTYTFVKLCEACVHHEGGEACKNPDEVQEEMVVYVSAVRRNGDGPPVDAEQEGANRG